MMAAMVIAYTRLAAAEDFMATKPAFSFTSPAYDWNGFYVGGHVGVAWGSSNWTTPNGPSGSTSFFSPIDTFNEGGSWFEGVQGGYNYILPNRWLIGGEVDATFPSFQKLPTGVNPFGVSIGGTSNFTSPTLGAVSFTETVLSEGTVRARFGYAPGHWLFYATGGFAWAYDQQSLTQVATGNTETPFLWRLGWTVGGGVEVPITPHWTARLEYLFKDYGRYTSSYSGGAQPISSDLTLNELRFGLNYQFGGDPALGSPILTKAQTAPDPDNVNFHGQFTLVEQGYPTFRSPYQGANSLPGSSQGRETTDLTLSVGVRLWQGAQAWIQPEIDQGHGLEDTHGVAGFTSAESYKIGFTYPYARMQRYFVRDTIDLGGETEKVDADFGQFAGTQTANRLVLTFGRFSVVDIFDTNKYANSAKNDFLNWSSVNVGSFDYAGDAWAYTYGAVAEWYQGNWTLRGGFFDMSQTPLRRRWEQRLRLRPRPVLRPNRVRGRNREALRTVGATRKDQAYWFCYPWTDGNLRERPRILRSDRPERQRCAGGRANFREQARSEPESGAAAHRDCRLVRPRRLGRRQPRGMGQHRHRPLGRTRRFHQRQAMGPAG